MSIIEVFTDFVQISNIGSTKISKKDEKTENISSTIEPEGLKYLIRRGNVKRESMWKNKNRFVLKQEILLCNAYNFKLKMTCTN